MTDLWGLWQNIFCPLWVFIDVGKEEISVSRQATWNAVKTLRPSRLALKAYIPGNRNVRIGWCWTENGHTPVKRVTWNPTVSILNEAEDCMAIQDGSRWMDIQCGATSTANYYRSLCQIIMGKFSKGNVRHFTSRA